MIRFSFFLLNLFIRKEWSHQEDIALLEKACLFPKKWAKISLDFFGRNQHSVKNRFIFLINREFNLKWNETKDFMKRDDLQKLTKTALQSLISLAKSEAKSSEDDQTKVQNDSNIECFDPPFLWEEKDETFLCMMNLSGFY